VAAAQRRPVRAFPARFSPTLRDRRRQAARDRRGFNQAYFKADHAARRVTARVSIHPSRRLRPCRPVHSQAMPSELLQISKRRQLEESQGRRIINLLRAAFLVLIVLVLALALVQATGEGSAIELVTWWPYALIGALLFFAFVIALDVLTPRRKLSAISAIVFGCFAGLVLTLLLGLVISYFADTYFKLGDPIRDAEIERVELVIKVLLGLGLCYLGAATVLQTQDDFRLVIPYVEFAKQIRGPRPLVLDSSALIDGRISDLAEAGLVQVPLIVPRFVIDELQTLADVPDKMKRARGRRGLDMVGKLQKNPRLDVSVDETAIPGGAVDQMLVEFARELPGTIVTTDTALNRIASIQGVSVINVHEIASALKSKVIPGEAVRLRLIKPGEQPGQGVGYLEDGQMVVAENGADAVGEEVTLIVTSTTQTSVGRLIFGRLATEDDMKAESGEYSAVDADSDDTRRGGAGGGGGNGGGDRPRARRRAEHSGRG
jgi:uncharacterized protein YacL